MKILVIAYFFPPQTSVGTFRTVRLLQRLKQQGWNAEILTVQHPSQALHPYQGAMPAEDEYLGFPVHRTPEWKLASIWRPITGLLKRIGLLFKRNWSESNIAKRLWFVDMEYGWIPSALKVGRTVIDQFAPDVIYVSCPPFSSALVARRLAKNHKLPFVLDFRDSWLLSDYSNPYEKHRYTDLQSRLLAEAEGVMVTTSSDLAGYQNWYSKTLQQSPDKAHLVHNAYDPEFTAIGDSNTVLEDAPLTLLYTGAWDSNARAPLRILKYLREMSCHWKLISVGPTNELVKQCAEELGIDPTHLDLRASVSKLELVPMMDEAQVLLLIQGPPTGGTRNTHIAAKTFDYLATGKPILAIAAPGDNRDFLAQYPERVYLADAESADDIRSVLQTLENDRILGKLKVQVRKDFLADYDGGALAQRAIEVLSQAVGKNANDTLS
ncbi:MAG: glycosyltransferase [Oceanococcus sp.]